MSDFILRRFGRAFSALFLLACLLWSGQAEAQTTDPYAPPTWQVNRHTGFPTGLHQLARCSGGSHNSHRFDRSLFVTNDGSCLPTSEAAAKNLAVTAPQLYENAHPIAPDTIRFRDYSWTDNTRTGQETVDGRTLYYTETTAAAASSSGCTQALTGEAAGTACFANDNTSETLYISSLNDAIDSSKWQASTAILRDIWAGDNLGSVPTADVSDYTATADASGVTVVGSGSAAGVSFKLADSSALDLDATATTLIEADP